MAAGAKPAAERPQQRGLADHTYLHILYKAELGQQLLLPVG
jgi:hypothetical protein